jgi:hypothetical protein
VEGELTYLIRNSGRYTKGITSLASSAERDTTNFGGGIRRVQGLFTGSLMKLLKMEGL